MSIDTERIGHFLLEIKSRSREIAALLAENTDEEILQELWRLKGLKYSLIEVAEAMANVWELGAPTHRGLMLSLLGLPDDTRLGGEATVGRFARLGQSRRQRYPAVRQFGRGGAAPP